MTKFLSRLVEALRAAGRVSPAKKDILYESTITIASRSSPGATFILNRMSFARRMGLCRRIREIAPKLEYLESGDELQEKVEANLLGREIETLYLEWGLVSLQGIAIDGEPATLSLLLEKGPEGLCREIVAAIQAECSLTESERKN